MALAAGAPPNDDFDSAITLDTPLAITTSGTLAEATLEPDEPDHAGLPHDASVWWQWTAQADETVTIDTCDGAADTVLAIYTGDALATLQAIASSGDSCPGGFGASRVSFAATDGVSYKIAVSGFLGLPGPRDVLLRIGNPPAPGNDEFASAFTIAGRAVGTNVGAGAQAGEPLLSVAPGARLRCGGAGRRPRPVRRP